MKQEYIHLPLEKAIPQMREDIHELLRSQREGRVCNPDGTKATEWFIVLHMVEYLLALAEQQQERFGS